MKKLFLLIFLTSCSSSNTTFTNNFQNFNFNKIINFDEFKKYVTEYAEKSPYPNIDK